MHAIHLDEFEALFLELNVTWACSAVGVRPAPAKSPLAQDVLPQMMARLIVEPSRASRRKLVQREMTVLSYLVLRLAVPGAVLTWGKRTLAQHDLSAIWAPSCDAFIDPNTPHYSISNFSAPTSLQNITMLLTPAPPLSMFQSLKHSFVIDQNQWRALAMHTEHGIPLYHANGSALPPLNETDPGAAGILAAMLADESLGTMFATENVTYDDDYSPARRLASSNPPTNIANAAVMANGVRPKKTAVSFGGADGFFSQCTVPTLDMTAHTPASASAPLLTPPTPPPPSNSLPAHLAHLDRLELVHCPPPSKFI